MKDNTVTDNTVTLVLSYCLYKDGTRLSKMAEESTRLGIATVREGKASHIIFSTAYGCWKKEAELKKDMAVNSGVSPDKIHFIEGVRHTFDEVKGLKSILGQTGAEKLIVICEKYHAPRVKRMLEKKFPEIQFDFRIFQSNYERTLEPSFIKSHRGYFFTWWLWNTACNMVW